MATPTITISMPRSLRLWVEDRAECGYGSISEYFRELVRLDQRRELERLDAAYERQKYRNKPAKSPLGSESRFC